MKKGRVSSEVILYGGCLTTVKHLVEGIFGRIPKPDVKGWIAVKALKLGGGG